MDEDILSSGALLLALVVVLALTVAGVAFVIIALEPSQDATQAAFLESHPLAPFSVERARVLRQGHGPILAGVEP